MSVSITRLAPAEYATNAFIRKISGCGSSSPDNAEFGHLTSLFGRGRQSGIYQELKCTCTAIVLLIKPFV